MATITVLNQGTLYEQGLPALQQTGLATRTPDLTQFIGRRATARNDDCASDIEVVFCLAGETITNGALVKILDDHTVTEVDPNDVGPCGVAMAAMANAAYGWVAVKGHVRVLSADVAAGAQLYIDNAVAGGVDDAAVGGDLVLGAFSLEADVTTSGAYNENTVKASITYPMVTNLLLVNP